MWRSVSLLAILIVSPAISRCDTVQFTVASANIGTPIQGPVDFDLFSAGLNGTVLSGQGLSLDLVLDKNVLARLFLLDPGTFAIGLNIYTNAGTFPGFAGPTTGYLLDANGNQFGGTQDAGRGASDDGTFGIGLVSFTLANLGGAEAVDISGVHFNTSLPDNGFVITDAQLRFSFDTAADSAELGTAQQLPEPSTTGLTLAGALFIGLTDWRSRRKQLSTTAS
jgi:hypothetical protein